MARVLVIDVGGSHVKLMATGWKARRRFDSGPHLTPGALVDEVRARTRDTRFDVVSLGYPGVVSENRVKTEPFNLAPGWVDFDFEAAFARPVKVINDAAMQAFGAYDGGRMLFLGLGTGLGSALLVAGEVVPLELAHLPYRKHRSYEDYVGQRGLDRLGRRKWEKHCWRVVELLRHALLPHEVVLGGGNARRLKHWPADTREVGNDMAFTGGFRLWRSTLAGAARR